MCEIKNLIIIGIIILLLDSIYLYATSFLTIKTIEKVQNSKFKLCLGSTIICYLILIFTIYYFIIIKKSKLEEAFILGLIIYSIYETTNYAIFKNWNIEIVIIDSIWGGLLFLLTTYIYRRII